ncbi:hypothetical protein GGS20DRAFT_442393 [Poronia punctata]|nr:hypothetical protein GGS20DRAFT_442393 [Poronia punctata]
MTVPFIYRLPALYSLLVFRQLCCLRQLPGMMCTPTNSDLTASPDQKCLFSTPALASTPTSPFELLLRGSVQTSMRRSLSKAWLAEVDVVACCGLVVLKVGAPVLPVLPVLMRLPATLQIFRNLCDMVSRGNSMKEKTCVVQQLRLAAADSR